MLSNPLHQPSSLPCACTLQELRSTLDRASVARRGALAEWVGERRRSAGKSREEHHRGPREVAGGSGLESNGVVQLRAPAQCGGDRRLSVEGSTGAAQRRAPSPREGKRRRRAEASPWERRRPPTQREGERQGPWSQSFRKAHPASCWVWIQRVVPKAARTLRPCRL